MLVIEYADGKIRRRSATHLLLVGDRVADRETLARAKAIKAKMEADLLDARWGPQTNPNPDSPLFDDFANRMIEHASTGMRSSMLSAIRRFSKFIGPDRTLRSITRADCQRWRDELLSTPDVSRNSAAAYVSRLRIVLSRAHREGLILTNPSDGIAIRADAKIPRFLTLDEVKQLATTPCSNPHIAASFLFACFSGLRHSDVARLTFRDIGGSTMTVVQKKTRVPIRVELSEQARRIVEEQRALDHGERVFDIPRIGTCNDVLHTWSKAAEVADFTYHASRHTFATMALGAGVGLYEVSRLLGHTSVRQTEKYLHWIDAARDAAVKKLPTLDIPKPEKR